MLWTVYVYAHGHALAGACFTLPTGGRRQVIPGQQPTRRADCGPWPGDELSQMRRVTDMVPRDAPTTCSGSPCCCGGCDIDEQFTLRGDLMIRGLDCEHDDPAPVSVRRPLRRAVTLTLNQCPANA